MSDANARLRALADHLFEVFSRHTDPDAALLAGSVAKGEADELSDIDLLIYHADLPSDEAVAAARDEVGATDLKVIAPRTEAGLLDQFTVGGVTCQVGQIAISDVEHDIRKGVVDLDPDAFTMKEMGGLHDGLPLAGNDLIAGWRTAATYSDDLQRTIVARHWKVVPLWKLAAHVAARDAELWRHQILVDGAYDLLAVLAATNRVWFSSFQFKRTRTLTGRLEVAPPDLPDRLEALFTLPPEESARELERLTDETRAILEARRLLP
jgi:Polymerase beta, Nucleotidyltransferase